MLRFYLAGFIGILTQVAVIKSSFACKSDADCKGERICEADKCVSPKAAPTACHQDTDCRGNDICEQSVCVPPATSATPTMVAAVTAGSMPVAAAAPPVVAVAAPPVAVVAPAVAVVAPPVAVVAPAAAPPTAAPAPPADTAVPYALPGTAPPPAAASPPAPAATATKAGPPAASKEATTYKSFTALFPDMKDFYGLSAHVEEASKSLSGPSWSPTMGVLYEFIGNPGSGNPADIIIQTLGMTVGIRPTGPRALSFALRAGAMVTLTHIEVGGSKSDDFDVALMAGGDIMLGPLVIGAQTWMRDGNLWMGRAGFAW